MSVEMSGNGLTHRVERFDLSVEQPVLLDARVAVHGPHQAERVPTAAAAAAAGVRILVRLGAEDGGRRPPVDLDVSPANEQDEMQIVKLSQFSLPRTNPGYRADPALI